MRPAAGAYGPFAPQCPGTWRRRCWCIPALSPAAAAMCACPRMGYACQQATARRNSDKRRKQPTRFPYFTLAFCNSLKSPIHASIHARPNRSHRSLCWRPGQPGPWHCSWVLRPCATPQTYRRVCTWPPGRGRFGAGVNPVHGSLLKEQDPSVSFHVNGQERMCGSPLALPVKQPPRRVFLSLLG